MRENIGGRPDEPIRSGRELYHERVSFIRPFDGTQPEIPQEEREEVAQRFRDAVSETLLREEHPVLRGTALLATELDGLNKIAVYVSEERGIGLQHEFGRYGKEGSDYVIDDTGTVIRTDYDPRKNRIDDLPSTLEELRDQPWEETEAILRNDQANSELEVDMGLNKQPVDLDEIQGVIDLIHEAQPRTDLDY